MAKKDVGKYQVYRLPSGDITVGRGAWLLLRWFKASDKIKFVDLDAPPAWRHDAEDLIEQEKKL